MFLYKAAYQVTRLAKSHLQYLEINTWFATTTYKAMSQDSLEIYNSQVPGLLIF